jgi:hypothetical protein
VRRSDAALPPAHPGVLQPEPEINMDEGLFDLESDSLNFPDDTVAGILNDPDRATAAVDKLVHEGIPENEIRVLCCDTGARRLDPSGERHGTVGRLHRLIQHFGDKEILHVERQAAELRDGNFLVAAPAADDDARDRVARILESEGGHFINYYTSWTVQRLVE